MQTNNLIKDAETRRAISRIEKILTRIESIPQLSTNASNEDIIKVINKITNSIKRR